MKNMWKKYITQKGKTNKYLLRIFYKDPFARKNPPKFL